MSRKRLHIHSLPLVVLSFAATGVLLTSAATAADARWAKPLVTPALRFDIGGRGAVQASANKPLPDEPAGATQELEVYYAGAEQTIQALDSLKLYIALENAVKK